MSSQTRRLVLFLCTCVIAMVLLHSTLQNVNNAWEEQIPFRNNSPSASNFHLRMVSWDHLKENAGDPPEARNLDFGNNVAPRNETVLHLQDAEENLPDSGKEKGFEFLTEENYTKDPPIDLDISVPGVNEIYDRLVLVTACSSNHYNEVMGFIGTAQKHMPGKKIIVYDLGLNKNEKKKMETLCQVEVRPFPFDAYPDHVRTLVTYAFKPILITRALNEFGAIYYGDASIRFMTSLKELLPGIERHHGFMTNILAFDPKHTTVMHHYFLTVPEMFEKLGVDRDEYYNSTYSAPHIQPGSQLIINSTTIQTKLMQPWLKCALEKACIAPNGSSKRNHRQDASAITLLVYKNLYREWIPEDNDTERMQKVVKVRRGSDGFKAGHPQFCNKTLEL